MKHDTKEWWPLQLSRGFSRPSYNPGIGPYDSLCSKKNVEHYIECLSSKTVQYWVWKLWQMLELCLVTWNFDVWEA